MGTFDIYNGLYSQNEALLVQGFNKLDTFVAEFEQAMMQFPQEQPGWVSYQSSEWTLETSELDSLLESGEWESLFSPE